MTQTDVIIAGAGPVGQYMALQLVEAGYDVTLVEAGTEPVIDFRASTFHAPTLDMLDEVGVGAPLIARGRICRDWEVRLHPTGDRALFDMAAIEGETAHPYRLQCEQWELQDILRQKLTGRCTEVMGTSVTGFEQDDDGVTVHIEGPEGPGLLRGRFLIGCDGARSAVRHALGFGFEGETYPETTYLTTTQFPFQDHIEGLSSVAYCWWQDGGNFSLLRMADTWRVSIYMVDGIPPEEQLRPEAVQKTLHRILDIPGDFELGMEPRPYRVHMRMADSYVAGRVVLAGDSAHLNSPVGGMGLNGGLHDARELMRALAPALDGADHGPLLARYDRRRRPIARDEIIVQADKARARMREKDPSKRLDLLKDLQAIAADPVRLKAHLMESSMITTLRRSEAVE
ncbi:FAD-dependent oxidoreductase [Pseudooceanicola nanhaiensis]|uniref:FAD-dependent oxidoreductase n=1 Tax=Pseudooceanicola nanhaiensis TaxID=375761 RepID=UPI001CD3B9C7|nr:NAD(P)/FAD-dependent oxidoreductase [Pseudooceanicola nanhaiensis]MCA0919968.1 FAD-dependent monooxygenase [Pseudooceanicola nanhaiensis]